MVVSVTPYDFSFQQKASHLEKQENQTRSPQFGLLYSCGASLLSEEVGVHAPRALIAPRLCRHGIALRYERLGPAFEVELSPHDPNDIKLRGSSRRPCVAI